VGVMLGLSRRRGVMVHCLAYCPIGWLAVTLGRLNPFRVRFTDACTACGACTRACRYAALSADDLAARAVGGPCPLCGDCLGACPHGALEYRFPGLSAATARRAFLVLVVALHAAFLNLAML